MVQSLVPFMRKVTGESLMLYNFVKQPLDDWELQWCMAIGLNMANELGQFG